MRLLLAAALATGPALPAAAGYWEYRDWRVHSEFIESAEDPRMECSARTGGDGLPGFGLQVSSLDVGPPHYFPEPALSEHALRHAPTVMRNGQPVAFLFDSGAVFYGLASGGINGEGFAEAQVSPRWQDSLAVLRQMKAAQWMEVRTMDITEPGRTVMTISLNGFTAAYGKMMDECGFSIELPAG